MELVALDINGEDFKVYDASTQEIHKELGEEEANRYFARLHAQAQKTNNLDTQTTIMLHEFVDDFVIGQQVDYGSKQVNSLLKMLETVSERPRKTAMASFINQHKEKRQEEMLMYFADHAAEAKANGDLDRLLKLTLSSITQGLDNPKTNLVTPELTPSEPSQSSVPLTLIHLPANSSSSNEQLAQEQAQTLIKRIVPAKIATASKQTDMRNFIGAARVTPLPFVENKEIKKRKNNNSIASRSKKGKGH